MWKQRADVCAALCVVGGVMHVFNNSPLALCEGVFVCVCFRASPLCMG